MELSTINMNQAYAQSKAKLSEILAKVRDKQDPCEMWQLVLEIQTFPDKYRLYFNCDKNTYSRIIIKLSEDRTAVAASYDYRDANSQWVGYPLRPSEQQMLLDFAASLKEYINPEIVRPDIVKCE